MLHIYMRPIIFPPLSKFVRARALENKTKEEKSSLLLMGRQVSYFSAILVKYVYLSLSLSISFPAIFAA